MTKPKPVTIEPCPFCDCPKTHFLDIFDINDEPVGCRVQCKYCGSHGPCRFGEKKAIAAWNKAPRRKEKK